MVQSRPRTIHQRWHPLQNTLKDTIDRIQNWYKLNCNGDWEHNHGLTIGTLDNPGWTVRIDLRETPLDNLDLQRTYQNPNDDHDWFHMKTNGQILEIACGPENLKQVFRIFLDEIVPTYSDKKFYYDIYLPVKFQERDIWVPAKAILINEEIVQLTKIGPVNSSTIRARDINGISFSQIDSLKLKPNYEVGDLVKIGLEDVDDGPILTAKNTE